MLTKKLAHFCTKFLKLIFQITKLLSSNFFFLINKILFLILYIRELEKLLYDKNWNA